MWQKVFELYRIRTTSLQRFSKLGCDMKSSGSLTRTEPCERLQARCKIYIAQQNCDTCREMCACLGTGMIKGEKKQNTKEQLHPLNQRQALKGVIIS
jgi:hypothetical protein